MNLTIALINNSQQEIPSGIQYLLHVPTVHFMGQCAEILDEILQILAYQSMHKLGN